MKCNLFLFPVVQLSCWRGLLVGMTFALAVISPFSVHAEDKVSDSSTNQLSEQLSEVKNRRIAIESELKKLINDEESSTHKKKISLMQSILSLLSQQVAVIQNITEIEIQRKSRQETQIDLLSSQLRSIKDFLSLEKVRVEYLQKVDKGKSWDKLVNLNITALETAGSNLESVEARKRKVKEELLIASDSGNLKTLERELKVIEKESFVAHELKSLRELELRYAKLNLELLKPQLKIMESGIEEKLSNIDFDNSDYDLIAKDLSTKEKKLTVKIQAAEAALQSTQEAYQRQKAKSNLSDNEAEHALARLAAVSQLKQKLVSVTRDSLDRLRLQGELWEKRGSVLRQQASREDKNKWSREVLRHLDGLSYVEQALSQDLLEAQKDMITGGDTQSRSVEITIADDLVKVYRDALKEVEQMEFLLRNFKIDLDNSLPSFDWFKLYSIAKDSFITIWTYEIFSTVDERPVTVSKVVVSLLLLVFGWFLSRYLSFLFVKRVLNRFHLNEGVVAAVQTILFYILIIFFTIFALHIANVPLTVFTVLGGAVAIGVGFGSQNIVNNFISGLILFTERPIKVGDLLDLDGTYGRVKSIGARSTVLRTSSNIDIIVPNSSFLEKNVVNWTRNDTKVRLSVTIGVIYGSPTKLVAKLLLESISKNSRVIEKSEATVIFLDFGDNALVFELHFWAQVSSVMEKKMLESEVRFRIDELFRENNLVIAFPQRDVHLDTVKPLEIRLLQTEDEVSPC